MNRLMGLVLAVTFVVVGRSAHAQMPGDVRRMAASGWSMPRRPRSNAYVLDRWWMVQATPSVGTTLPPQTVGPAARRPSSRPIRGRVTRAARSGPLVPEGRRPGVRPRRDARPRPRFRPDRSTGRPPRACPLYSPAQRYAAYGQGYGVSPYGSADYGAQYKGIVLGQLSRPIAIMHQRGPVRAPHSGDPGRSFAFRAGIIDLGERPTIQGVATRPGKEASHARCTR